MAARDGSQGEGAGFVVGAQRRSRLKERDEEGRRKALLFLVSALLHSPPPSLGPRLEEGEAR